MIRPPGTGPAQALTRSPVTPVGKADSTGSGSSYRPPFTRHRSGPIGQTWQTPPSAQAKGKLRAPCSAQCYSRSNVQLLRSRNIARKPPKTGWSTTAAAPFQALTRPASRRRFPGARFKLHSAVPAGRGFVQRRSFQNPRGTPSWRSLKERRP